MAECSAPSSSSSSLSWYAARGIKLQHEVPSHEMAAFIDAKISHCAGNNFRTKEELKSVTADYDLTYVQTSDLTMKESLRKTLVNQEEIFKKQVAELHRVYRIQKNLMKDFGQKGLDAYDFDKTSTKQKLVLFTNHMTDQSVAAEKAFLKFPELFRTQPINHCLEEQGMRGDSNSRIQQMSLDHELLETKCIHDTEKGIVNKAHGWDTAENLAEVKRYSHRETEYSWNDLRLSLCIGMENWQNGGGRRTCSKKDIPFSSPCIIDLEESTETVSRGDVRVKPALFSPIRACFGDKQESPKSIQSSFSFAKSLNQNEANGRINCLEDNSSRGSNQWHSDLTRNDATDNIFREELDLNRDLVDESSSHFNGVSMASPPRGNSAGGQLVGEHQEHIFPGAICWKKLEGNCSHQTSIFLQQETVTSTVIDSDCKNNGKIVGGSMMCPIDLEHTTGVPPEHQGDPNSQNASSLHINAPGPSNENSRDVGNLEINSENVKEDIVFSDLHNIEDTGSNGSCASCNSSRTTANGSSTQAVQSATDLAISNVVSDDMFQYTESSEAEKSPPGEESKSFAVNEVKSETDHKRKEEFAEWEATIQRGAVSLVYFALGSNSRDEDGGSKAEETNKIRNMKKDQPQCSSESYESNVLKRPESSVDDYCVSSKQFEFDDTCKKDCRIKLKRGTRLKDFQKDILPQLSSLSSHEIFEDLKIMEGVLRSREYKRLRSKMNNAQSWSSPVRSRRSRPNFVGRRFYS